MLAAAEALGSSGHAAQYRRRLVFVALSGEPWGLMGSKRLLWELAAGGNATSGLDLARIDQACCSSGRTQPAACACMQPLCASVQVRMAMLNQLWC